MIAVSQRILVALALSFSGYHVVLGVYALTFPPDPPPSSIVPAIIGMVLYGVATALSLWRITPVTMPTPVAAFVLGVAVVLPILVSSQLDPDAGNLGYSTWYVAAVGTLLTITAARRQLLIAWLGVGWLVVQTAFWAGLDGLIPLGVPGCVVWVGMAHVLGRALAKAARDTRQFVVAQQEASAWQAAQDAHHSERTLRLGTTARMAEPMLRRIAAVSGDLDAAERHECRLLESGIRDEIRGRSLLDDPVRREVLAARRRGATVTLLDEGGLDDLEEAELARVHAALAAAIGGTVADQIIVRTVTGDGDVAVTVVGLRSAAAGESALGPTDEDDGEEVDLWLEIPRRAGSPESRLQTDPAG